MKVARSRLAAGISAALLATTAVAATLYIKLDSPVVVSTDDPANNAYKGRLNFMTYKSDAALADFDVRAQFSIYSDGAPGAQNIWFARSVDNGKTWAQQRLTTNGGAPLTVTDPVSGTTGTFSVIADKASMYNTPVGQITGGKGADLLVTWSSSDCEGSAAQRINANLDTGPQPYMCLWAARSLDGGTSWTKARLTDGAMDVINDVPSGYLTSNLASGGFAISFQADPAGLQQGEAEGPGDGDSGAKVSPGTNIWYTFLSKANFENGNAFPPPVQVSDNNDTAKGSPGASRANLTISGGTALLAYEETKGGGGKQIIYHSFPYAGPETNNAGTIASDPAKNARRARILAQGNDALGDADKDGDAADGDTKGVHVVLIWREATVAIPDAPSDIVVRRGIKDTTLRPGSTGFLGTDVTADTPSTLSDTGTGDSSLAHRGALRGESVAIGFDRTPDKALADAFNGTYNFYIRTSKDGGDTWGDARNMSNLTGNALRVKEPRLVPTPGSIRKPDGTATADPSDVQNRNVFFAGWATETNAAVSVPQDIFLTRTTDWGATYEAVQPLAAGPAEQFETQLRSTPDGKQFSAIWMEASAGATDVVYRNGVEDTAVVVNPASTTVGGNGGCTIGSDGRVDLTLAGLLLAALAALGLRRRRAKARGGEM